MRIPKSPPDIETIKQQIKSDPQKAATLLDVIGPVLIEGKYLHWDKLLYYPPPEGISHELWWFVIKQQRRSLFKTLPLLDKNQKQFCFLITDSMTQILHQIDHSAAAFNQMPEQMQSTEAKNQYYVNTMIQEAFASSQLEGAATTRLVAKEMILANRAPIDKSEQMILNNFSAMKEILKLKDEPLSKNLVFKIHRLVTHDTLDNPSAAGRFRNADERIVIRDMYNEIFHEPPAADKLEERMQAMCAFTNGENSSDFIHPVIRAITLHFWLAYDHPFVDGNGRTARAIFYWLMLRHRYWLFEFVSISQIFVKAPAKYGRAFLYTETDDNDLTYFILYHLEVIEKAIKELHKYIERKTKAINELETKLHGIVILNHRQRALIGHALRHPNFKYTFRSHQTSHNVAYETARTDLINLEERRLLKSYKVGKTWYFTPLPDLEKKLENLD